MKAGREGQDQNMLAIRDLVDGHLLSEHNVHVLAEQHRRVMQVEPRM